jgi:hypothetical protein
MTDQGINWQFIVDDEDDYDVPLGIPVGPSTHTPGWSADNAVFIEISMHQDEAGESKAIELALKKFKNNIDIPSGLTKIDVVNVARRVLFTSIQIEYTVELIVDKDAARVYYDRVRRKK